MQMIVGLPDVRRGPLLDQAQRLGATVLVSANRPARRPKDRLGIPCFRGFDPAPLACLRDVPACLDSAGFVAMAKYRGFDWTVAQYVALGAAHPWLWFASMDACVEPEVAPNRCQVLDRIAWTVALNRECLREARHLGCADRLMPVIQGARPDDYLRCLDGMAWATDRARLGVGSMCRRRTGGVDGILACVDAIDRALGAAPARLHLFGVKSDAAEALRAHPRIESADSQAYGVQARQVVLRQNLAQLGQGDLLGPPLRISKSDRLVAAEMGRWFGKQSARLARAGRRPGATDMLVLPAPLRPEVEWERRVAQARDEIRALVAEGEMDWSQMNERVVMEWAADLDLEAEAEQERAA